MPATRPPVSAHFVNNVLAAAASYIEDDPDYARDVLAELGQFLSYRLREDPGPVSAAQELAHTATYLRLQQARFPDRISFALPARRRGDRARWRRGRSSVRSPRSLGRRLRERSGPCALTLRAAGPALDLELAGAGDAAAEHLMIPIAEGAPA